MFVDDDDVRYLDGLKTDVPDGQTVSIIPAVAGGVISTVGRRSGAGTCDGCPVGGRGLEC